MILAWARRLLPGVWLFTAACTSGGPATPGDGGVTVGTLRFDADGVLTLAPGDVVTVTVIGGAGVDVLIALEGDYGDASIDASRLVLNATGRATFKLRAPKTPSTFALRASSDQPTASARLDVAVGRDGFGTVRVTPHYKGARAAPEVWGSAFLKSSCKDLTKAAPKDGAPLVAGTMDVPFDLKSVPAGASVAISVRIGHYSVGCTDVTDLAPNGTRDVAVEIYDRPLDIAAVDLEARLTFAPSPTEQTAWDARMDGAIQLVAGKVSPLGTSSDDATRLLDAMALVAQNAGFGTARGGGWDAKTATWLSQHPSIRTTTLGWLNAGKTSTLADLIFHIGPDQTDQQTALTLANKDLGFSIDVPFSLVPDADDTLRVEGPIAAQPTAIVTRTADVRAAADVAQSTDVPSALAIRIDCAGLAQNLLGGQTYAYGVCNAACMEQLCTGGLSATWKGAHDASQKLGDTTAVVVNASGKATVGEYADPAALTGTWVGQVKGGTADPSALHGALRAAKGQVPN
jgi:hypothetical protein